MKSKIVAVVGPTAVGKSEVALELATALNGEIVNADSQQVYRYLNIGTAKPSAAERARVAHHLIDIVDPDEEFSAARFRTLALESIEGIHGRGHAVILCGGTGLYLKALTRGLFIGPARDETIRARLTNEMETIGLPALYGRLEEVDRAATSWIHPNDRQRIVRALEVFELTGKPISEWQKEHGFSDDKFDRLVIGLDQDRQRLYDAIDQRCVQMIEQGLVQEVSNLVQQGYELHLKPLQSVGYRHAGMIITGQMDASEALALMQRDTRHLARRQLTWFRAEPGIRWFDPDARVDIYKTVKRFLLKGDGGEQWCG